MPLNKSIKKVLMIGSGPIVIGQAAEFDYAGAQACRVLKAAGVNVVLVNSNPATIMTDKALADEIYLEPLTVETVKRIIEKEKPDSMLAGLGGQTGLTMAMQLDKEGFLEAHGVKLIGTNVDAIDKAEDRQLFKVSPARTRTRFRVCSREPADSDVCGSSMITSEGRTLRPSERLYFIPRTRPVIPATRTIMPDALLSLIVGSTISLLVQVILVRSP